MITKEFRAWNNIVKRYSEIVTLEQLYNTKNVQFQNLIFEQYIGIKAEYKEEKKIFEGDIIRNKYTNQLYVVKWVGVGFKLMDYACNYHPFFDSFSMEVVGNIHQDKKIFRL